MEKGGEYANLTMAGSPGFLAAFLHSCCIACRCKFFLFVLVSLCHERDIVLSEEM